MRNVHDVHGSEMQNRRVPQPEQPTSRRAARDAAASGAPARRRIALLVATLVAVIVLAVAVAVLRLGVSGGAPAASGRPDGPVSPTDAVTLPAGAGSNGPATGVPVPAQSAAAASSCDDPTVAAALAGGDDDAVIAAFGGGAAFRAAVVSGAAPCIDLGDPHRLWIVVDKKRPLNPLDVEPPELVAPADMQRTVDGRLQPAAAQALTALVAAAADEGAGAIGLNSAYRSFASQTRIYNGYVNSLGRAGADQQSARPGYSEHQTGLATDVAACDSGCGAIEVFGGTRQGGWVAENAWRFGYIVRYESGYTNITGYEAEPWHLRYIGTELATAYHDGGFHTLEDFFGLPAAPDY